MDKPKSLKDIIGPQDLTKAQRDVITSLSKDEVEMLLKVNAKLEAAAEKNKAAGIKVEGRDDEEFVICVC